jgi:hypothetical protein
MSGLRNPSPSSVRSIRPALWLSRMSVRCSPEDLVTVVLEGHPTHIQRAFPSKLALHQGPTGCQVHDSSGSLAIKRRYGQLVIENPSSERLDWVHDHKELHDKYVPAASTSQSRPHPLDETSEPRHKRIPSFVTSTSSDQASGSDADRTCNACHSIRH